MVTHLEPDNFECKVKCALGSITANKATGGDGISPKLFQILKDDAVQVLLVEAEGIKKRWQEYTEELYKKDLMTQIIRMV